MASTLPSTSTSTLASTPFDLAAVAIFQESLLGNAYLPGDEGFMAASAAWAALIRHEPAIAVMAQSAEDVIRAVRFANEHDLPIAVQGTGHGIPVPCVGGMLINTARMQGVTVFPESRSVRVEAGVKWERVIPLAQEHGLAPLAGSSTDVGVIGYTLGGGYGWLARKYGRAADRIISADVVTADGRMIHVTPETEPALFWALKGGSGNFGIVTELEFGLVPVENVFGGSVMYPLADAKRILSTFNVWSTSLPDDITASVGIMRIPPLPQLPPMLQGAEVVVIRACAVGDLAAGEAAIAPMRALGTPILDTFGVLPFTEIDAISMDPKESMPAMATTMILRDLDDATIDALLAVAGPDVETPVMSIDIRDLRSRGETAGLPVFALGVPFNEDAAIALGGALTEIQAVLQPHTTGRVLLNFLGDGDLGPERTVAAFPEADFARMQELKRRYDPQNRFRFNHNIAP